MSDDQDHPRPGGDAATERVLDELRELRADVTALLGRFETLQLRLLGDGQQTLIEQVQDNLADVASGEVVGALWEEVRAVRAQLDGATPAAGTAEPDPQLSALSAELAVLRAELADGLVVEPSDALSASLDALRSEVDGLRGSLGELPAPGDGAGVEAVADQVAALRDFVASELDTVRQTVTARIDAATEATAASVAAATARAEPEPAPAEGGAGIDADTVAMLRDEIRAAGAVSDQVVDALRDELKALRRRIAVKAAEQVLDDQQLAQIADAVAARLAADRDQV